MPSKTISLEQGAYERLKAAKREGESFSKVVLRLTQPKHRDPLAGVVGLLSGPDGEEFERVVRGLREADRDETETRHRRLGLT